MHRPPRQGRARPRLPRPKSPGPPTPGPPTDPRFRPAPRPAPRPRSELGPPRQRPGPSSRTPKRRHPPRRKTRSRWPPLLGQFRKRPPWPRSGFRRPLERPRPRCDEWELKRSIQRFRQPRVPRRPQCRPHLQRPLGRLPRIAPALQRPWRPVPRSLASPGQAGPTPNPPLPERPLAFGSCSSWLGARRSRLPRPPISAVPSRLRPSLPEPAPRPGPSVQRRLRGASWTNSSFPPLPPARFRVSSPALPPVRRRSPSQRPSLPLSPSKPPSAPGSAPRRRPFRPAPSRWPPPFQRPTAPKAIASRNENSPPENPMFRRDLRPRRHASQPPAPPGPTPDSHPFRFLFPRLRSCPGIKQKACQKRGRRVRALSRLGPGLPIPEPPALPARILSQVSLPAVAPCGERLGGAAEKMSPLSASLASARLASAPPLAAFSESALLASPPL